MCWVCNPSCGKCKPPIQIIKCPACGAHNLASAAICKKCRKILPERTQTAVICQYSGLKCVNPCGRQQNTPKDGVTKPCKQNTPPAAANKDAAGGLPVTKDADKQGKADEETDRLGSK